MAVVSHGAPGVGLESCEPRSPWLEPSPSLSGRKRKFEIFHLNMQLPPVLPPESGIPGSHPGSWRALASPQGHRGAKSGPPHPAPPRDAVMGAWVGEGGDTPQTMWKELDGKAQVGTRREGLGLLLPPGLELDPLVQQPWLPWQL